MKIMLFNGSPRPESNTGILLEEAILGAKTVGVEGELVHLNQLHIGPCQADMACHRPHRLGKCILDDDMSALATRIRQADGFIFGTPVYFWSMSSQMQVFLHRTMALAQGQPPGLKGKPAGLIVVAGRRGCQNVVNVFNMLFITSRMPTPDAVYGYAYEKGEIRQDTHAMKSAFELGRCLGLMVGQRDRTGLPAEYNEPFLPLLVCRKYDLPLAPGGKPVPDAKT